MHKRLMDFTVTIFKKPGTVAHIYNPSFSGDRLGGRDWEDHGQPRQKLGRPHLSQ
jgi:hypothetical protein